MSVILAVDVMGSDYGPEIMLQGLSLFHDRCPEVGFFVFGSESVINPFLSKKASLKSVCEICHTDDVIEPHVKPSNALRGMPYSSMKKTLEAVRDKRARAAISAGNTGAYLVLAKTLLKTIGGIDRPAIISQVPSLKGDIVMLDLGGTLDASSQNLVDYAFMGAVFAQKILGIHRPRVGLLNVGKEKTKGDDSLQQAFMILKDLEGDQKQGIPDFEFYGFVEGNDVPLGTVSVVVTDGFTGNVALKTAEGINTFFIESLKKALSSTTRGRLAGWLATPSFKALKELFDPRSYNGALWLGLKGIAVKSHGNADAVAFAHAIEMAYDMVKHDVISAIEDAFCDSADNSSFQASQTAEVEKDFRAFQV